jgi:hypothetical protein
VKPLARLVKVYLVKLVRLLVKFLVKTVKATAYQHVKFPARIVKEMFAYLHVRTVKVIV